MIDGGRCGERGGVQAGKIELNDDFRQALGIYSLLVLQTNRFLKPPGGKSALLLGSRLVSLLAFLQNPGDWWNEGLEQAAAVSADPPKSDKTANRGLEDGRTHSYQQ